MTIQDKTAFFSRTLTLPAALGDWTTFRPKSDSQRPVYVGDSIDLDHIKSVHMLHYYFAQNWKNWLSNQLALDVDVESVSIYRTSCVNLTGMQPNALVSIPVGLDQLGDFYLNFSLEFTTAFLHRVTGGDWMPHELSGLTDMDRVLFELHTQMVVSELNLAWRNVLQAHHPFLQSSQILEKDARDFGTDLIALSFSMRVNSDFSGNFWIMYPARIIRQLLQSYVVQPEPRSRSIHLGADALSKASVSVVAELGMGDITMSDLQGLSIGDVVPLQAKLDSLVAIQIADSTLLGQPGYSSGRISVQIVDPAQPASLRGETLVENVVPAPDSSSESFVEEDMYHEALPTFSELGEAGSGDLDDVLDHDDSNEPEHFFDNQHTDSDEDLYAR